MTQVERGWPDLHGFGGLVRGFEEGDDEHDEHGKGNRYQHTHTRFPITPAGPNHPPKSNQTTRKIQRVESCGEIK